MKKKVVALLSGALILGGAWQLEAAVYNAADLLGYGNGANDNPHNLSRMATHGKVKAVNDGSLDSTRICVYCHTPHGATAQSTLWNRRDPANMGSFPLYDSTAIAIDDAAITGSTKYKADQSLGEYPNGATKLCLSCHDGATALGQMNNGITITMNYATMDDWATADPGNASTVLNPANFNRTHPVSFVYTAAVRDYINGAGGKIGYALPTDPDVRLDGESRMQCTTCHDPHKHTRKGGYTLPFWANNDTGFDSGNGGNNDYDNTCKQCHTTYPAPPANLHNM